MVNACSLWSRAITVINLYKSPLSMAGFFVSIDLVEG